MIARTSLKNLVGQIDRIPAVRKVDLALGDCLIVNTRNSCYRLVSLGNGQFLVSGGWFEKAGMTGATTGINGCTFGGTVIHAGLAAGQGLFLEFDNNVRTTRIQRFRVIQQGDPAVVH
jgi:hypothetical protein